MSYPLIEDHPLLGQDCRWQQDDNEFIDATITGVRRPVATMHKQPELHPRDAPMAETDEYTVRSSIAECISARLGTLDRAIATPATHALKGIGGEVYEAVIKPLVDEIVSLREQLQAADAMRAGYDRLADYIATTGASEPDFATFLSDLMSSATAYDLAGKEPTP